MTSTPVTSAYNTSNVTQQSCREALCIFYAVANSIIFILGVAGNGLVIWIAGFKLKRSVNTTWYLSLAVSDFILCSSLPFFVIYMIKNCWVFGLFMCRFMDFNMSLNMFNSIFLLVVISVDRCVVVMFPVWSQNHRTAKKASVVVVLAWIISAVLSTPSALVRFFRHAYHYERKICYPSYKTDQERRADVAFTFFFGFVIPFLIIILCYVVIIQKLKSSQMAKSKKPFKIMTVLIAAFLICWLPYHTFALMRLNEQNYESFLPTASVFAITLSSANSCLNPFLYAFMGKDFKMQCYGVLSKIENAIEEESKHRIRGTAVTNSEDGKL
ncbi:chemerin-like receptor 1 [Salminus brasiliensis]|uniref:chemerin-like receptor 1 n=1 Tax=Salminus brasiliensis TaxID=930266 RepID=UPI003B8308A2